MQNYVNQFNCKKPINQRASTSNFINQTCFPLSLATNLLTNHGEIQEQITLEIALIIILYQNLREIKIFNNIKFKSKEKQATSINQIASK